MLDNLTEQQIIILRKDMEEQMRVLYTEVAQTLTKVITKIGTDIEDMDIRLTKLETLSKVKKVRDPKTEGREL